MNGISTVMRNSAGGLISGPGATGWSVDGFTISLRGDSVIAHGEPPHAPSPSMVEGSSWFNIDGVPVVCATCSASCGHQANGVDWFTIPK